MVRNGGEQMTPARNPSGGRPRETINSHDGPEERSHQGAPTRMRDARCVTGKGLLKPPSRAKAKRLFCMTPQKQQAKAEASKQQASKQASAEDAAYQDAAESAARQRAKNNAKLNEQRQKPSCCLLCCAALLPAAAERTARPRNPSRLHSQQRTVGTADRTISWAWASAWPCVREVLDSSRLVSNPCWARSPV